MKKKKIINDPVYGFITISSPLLFELIEHPYFQRLRHIRQLGLGDLVYPGAVHTRFHHALGALHLMGRVLDGLRARGVDISESEYEAAQIAILLHDIGHGPFSHALEQTLWEGVSHESLSLRFMLELNRLLGGALDTALRMFRHTYPRAFFHQLISSQLDIDRLDYLNRDSFYTGVVEGSIGIDRIIAMLHVQNDRLVVEEKGIYSIENFLHARRLMYWQVYLHKTAVSAERMMVNLIRRAQLLRTAGEPIFTTPTLDVFLQQPATPDRFAHEPSLLSQFGQLDDNDIWAAIKMWQHERDRILRFLSTALLERQLFRIVLRPALSRREEIAHIRTEVIRQFDLFQTEAPFLYSHGSVSNEAYVEQGESINVWMKDGRVLDIAQASDLPSIKAISKIVKKHYLCWPKNLSL